MTSLFQHLRAGRSRFEPRLSSSSCPEERAFQEPRSPRTFPSLLLFGIALLAGCQTVPPLPAQNVAGPGWIVRQGQAVWRAQGKTPDIAGELLLATHPDGRSVLQFTKTPFPILMAQKVGPQWEIQLPPRQRVFSGKGEPPARFIWLHLARCLYEGDRPPDGWSLLWRDNRWLFENHSTGERLEGYLKP